MSPLRPTCAAAALLVVCGSAAAMDLPLQGRSVLVSAAGVAKFVADADVDQPLPVAGSAEDPRLHGAEIRLFDTDGALGLGAGDVTHPLPAAGWRGLGSPPGADGYLYRGRDAGDDVCKGVLLKRRSVRALCKRDPFPVRPPFRGGAGVILGLPAAATATALRYCADFGGDTTRNDASRLQRRAAPAPPACPSVRPPPNFVVINLDDTRFDGIDLMPALQNRLVAEGVSFSESFVPNAVCCPSRASILSGLYSIHHGTRAVGGLLGGADTFRQSGADQQTIAVWLHDAGYTTGLFGKYLNEYGTSEATQGPGGTFYIPPGWDRWRAQIGIEAYGGVHGRTYEILDEARVRTLYADHSSDAQYGTDLLAQWMRDFITDAVAAGQPFFAYWAPYASHGDPVLPAPAARHAGTFAGLSPWRPPNWNEADISDKPRWFALIGPGPLEPTLTDNVRVAAYESLLAVDEQVALLLDHLAALGADDHTVVLLTSDNGASWGSHRMFLQLKEAPYEECIRVPMVVRYPRGQRAGVTVEAPVLNIDVAPTLMALTGLPQPAPVDGRSFAAALGGAVGPAPRGDFLLEHFRQARNHALSYTGQVADGDRVRVFFGDSMARPRASVLFEFDANASVAPGAIAVAIGATDDASFATLRAAIAAAVSQTQVTHNPTANQLGVIDLSPTFEGRYVQDEVDQGGVMKELGNPNPPDYVGVRDVARGYTYVEYETNEFELYDLNVDPWQLQNVAGAPAYAALRAELAARLGALLAGAP